MSDYRQGRDSHIVSLEDGKGYGWLLLFILLTYPFLVASERLHKYALFIDDHTSLAIGVFIGLSVLITYSLYRERRVRYKVAGILGVIVSFLPIVLAQVLFVVPYILSSDRANETTFQYAVGTTFTWFMTSFFTLGSSFFVNQISLQLTNGIKHLLIAFAYLAIALLFIL